MLGIAGMTIMLVGAFVELCRSIQTMNSMGILRGAGDVKFAMLNDILFLWGHNPMRHHSGACI